MFLGQEQIGCLGKNFSQQTKLFALTSRQQKRI